MRFRPRCTNSIIAFYFAFALLVPVTSPASEDSVAAAEMRELISGNTLSGKTEKGDRFHVYHDPSGTMEGTVRRQHYDSGSWEITDEHQYCRQWRNWRNGARRCFTMYRLDKNKYRLKAIGDLYNNKFKIQEGDSERLKVN